MSENQEQAETSTHDTAQLRTVIREELDSHFKDVPRRADVERLIDAKIQTATASARAEASQMIEARVQPLDKRFDSIDKRFDSLERMLTDMIKGLSVGIQQVTDSVTNNMQSQQVSLDRLSKRIAGNDARLDRIEPVATTNNKMLVGDTDGTPGLRVQVSTLAAGQGAIRADVGAVKAMLENQEARAEARRKLIKGYVELLTQPGLLRVLAGLGGLALGLLGLDIFGGL